MASAQGDWGSKLCRDLAVQPGIGYRGYRSCRETKAWHGNNKVDPACGAAPRAAPRAAHRAAHRAALEPIRTTQCHNSWDRATESGIPSKVTCYNPLCPSRLLLLSKHPQSLPLPIFNAHPFSISNAPSLLTSNTHSFSNLLLWIGESTQNEIFQIT